MLEHGFGLVEAADLFSLWNHPEAAETFVTAASSYFVIVEGNKDTKATFACLHS